MIVVPDYRIIKNIYESDSTLVYRAIRSRDNLPVILKIRKEGYAAPEKIIKYKQEFEVARSLNLKGAVKALGFEKYNNTFFIIFEDIGAVSLDRLMAGKRFTVKEFLAIAIKIIESLGEIHAHNIIHRDINPSNIIFNSETDQLQIIDFGISKAMLRGDTTINKQEILEGTLAYI